METLRSGEQKIRWAEAHMPVLAKLREEFRQEMPLRGHRIGMCIHLEAKTAVLSLALKEAGAEVFLASSNPLSTQDDVAEAVGLRGVTVHARHGVDMAGYQEFLKGVLASSPTLILDDGGDLVTLSMESGVAQGILGGTEETTTGLIRLRSLERSGRLPFPVVAVNDSPMKHLFDNRYGTGQSVLDGLVRTTNLSLAGKRFVVVGFGDCGRGVALRARGMGARVAVVEIDPVRANEAYFEGYDVVDMDHAAAWGEVFVTVTGNLHVIRGKHFDRMPDGALMANAGHFDVEIDKEDLAGRSVEVFDSRRGVRSYRQSDGRVLHLLADGRLVNLAAADGHPVEIMDLSFSLQALSLLWLARERPSGRVVHAVPEALDTRVAQLSLAVRRLGLEFLTEEQRAYLGGIGES